MKKVFLGLVLVMSSLFADLEWVSYDTALENAKENNKLIMVMLGRENCPACEYMKDIVFEDPKAIAVVQEDFIPVYLDIHNDFLPNGMDYIGTPTFHFINEHAIKKGRIDGGVNVKDFLFEIDKVKAKK